MINKKSKKILLDQRIKKKKSSKQMRKIMNKPTCVQVKMFQKIIKIKIMNKIITKY